MPGAPSLSYHESSHVLLTPYTGVRRQVRGNQLGPALVESRSQDTIGSLSLQCNTIYVPE